MLSQLENSKSIVIIDETFDIIDCMRMSRRVVNRMKGKKKYRSVEN